MIENEELKEFVLFLGYATSIDDNAAAVETENATFL